MTGGFPQSRPRTLADALLILADGKSSARPNLSGAILSEHQLTVTFRIHLQNLKRVRTYFQWGLGRWFAFSDQEERRSDKDVERFRTTLQIIRSINQLLQKMLLVIF